MHVCGGFALVPDSVISIMRLNSHYVQSMQVLFTIDMDGIDRVIGINSDEIYNFDSNWYQTLSHSLNPAQESKASTYHTQNAPSKGKTPSNAQILYMLNGIQIRPPTTTTAKGGLEGKPSFPVRRES
jgi:hypothetical protein